MAAFEGMPLVGITPPVVREWHAAALRGKGGRTSIQQSYRFLRAVMNCAIRGGAIRMNPCNISGAGSDRAKERPVASIVQVAALVGAITPWYRAAVLLAAWCGLRRGEIIALRREDIDLDAGTVTVRRARVELPESPGAAFDADPKTDAGKRTVAVPPRVLPVLQAHMSKWAGPDLVFVRRDGQPMRGDARLLGLLGLCLLGPSSLVHRISQGALPLGGRVQVVSAARSLSCPIRTISSLVFAPALAVNWLSAWRRS